MKRWRYLLAARTSVHEVVAVAPLMQLLPLPPPVVILAVSAVANDADAFWLMAQVNSRVLYKLLSHPKWKSDSGGSGKEERREKRIKVWHLKGKDQWHESKACMIDFAPLLTEELLMNAWCFVAHTGVCCLGYVKREMRGCSSCRYRSSFYHWYQSGEESAQLHLWDVIFKDSSLVP